MNHRVPILFASLLLTSSAWAQDTADVSTAREIAKQGLQAYDAGDWATADVQLGRAYAVVKVPTIALYRSRALVKLGKLVEAAELYLEATRLEASGVGQEGQERAKQEARVEREALLPRIPRVVVVVQGASADQVAVEIDGASIPSALFVVGRQVNPGTHRVVGRLGQQEVVTVVTVGESESKTARLVLAAPSEVPAPPPAAPPVVSPPASAPPPGPATESTDPSSQLADEPDQGRGGSVQSTLGWLVLAGGGAGLVVGGVTGLMASSKRNALDEGGCQDGVCYDDQAGDVDSYNQLRSISTVGFVVGGIGVLTGATLLLIAPSDQPDSAEVRAWVGVASAGVAGRF